jgi:hypothetical protein
MLCRKHCIEQEKQWDFLKELTAKIPDVSAEVEESDEPPPGSRRGRKVYFSSRCIECTDPTPLSWYTGNDRPVLGQRAKHRQGSASRRPNLSVWSWREGKRRRKWRIEEENQIVKGVGHLSQLVLGSSPLALLPWLVPVVAAAAAAARPVAW